MRPCAFSYKNLPKYRSYRVSKIRPPCSQSQLESVIIKQQRNKNTKLMINREMDNKENQISSKNLWNFNIGCSILRQEEFATQWHLFVRNSWCVGCVVQLQQMLQDVRIWNENKDTAMSTRLTRRYLLGTLDGRQTVPEPDVLRR